MSKPTNITGIIIEVRSTSIRPSRSIRDQTLSWMNWKYPANVFFDTSVSAVRMTRFSLSELVAILTKFNIKEYDKIEISATISQGNYATLYATDLSYIQTIQQS